MTGFTCSRYGTVGAAATAAVMTLGLVTAYPVSASSLAARPEVAAVQLQAAVATEVAALMNSSPHAAAVGIASTTTPVTSTGDAVTAPSVSTADATAVDDILTSIGRVALTVAGAVLSPIWYLAFPITMGLGSLWGYMNPIYRGDVVGAIFFLTSTINFFSWLSFPFRLGEALFPQSAPEPAANRPAATVPTVNPDAEVTAAVGVSDPATAAEATKPGPSQPTRQRSTTAARSAAETAPSDPGLTTTATITPDTVTTADEPVAPAQSGLVSEVANKTASSDPHEAPSTGPVSQATRLTKSIANTPSGQRGDNSTSTRSGRVASE